MNTCLLLRCLCWWCTWPVVLWPFLVLLFWIFWIAVSLCLLWSTLNLLDLDSNSAFQSLMLHPEKEVHFHFFYAKTMKVINFCLYYCVHILLEDTYQRLKEIRRRTEQLKRQKSDSLEVLGINQSLRRTKDTFIPNLSNFS